MIVSREASSKFHRKSFQNDRFARGYLQISQKKLPKRSFRARLLPNFIEKASKTSVSYEASYNFHRRSFQNDRFARSPLQISQKKLPKRAFRSRLLPNFTEEASKMIVSFEASSKFHRRSLQNTIVHTPRTMRGAIPSAQNFASRHSFVRSTHRILREGSSGKIKMCVSLQRRAIQNFKMCVSLQPRA